MMTPERDAKEQAQAAYDAAVEPAEAAYDAAVGLPFSTG
jgi:hypothetical protein